MYQVIETFDDLHDPLDGRFYHYEAGDTYPRDGYIPEALRIEELSGVGNYRGYPVIKEVKKKIARKKAE